MVSHNELVEAFDREARSGKASSMFIDGDVMYSYDHHFPLAVRMDWGYLLNGDRHSVTTSRHQSHCRCLTPNIIVPFSALQGAGIYPIWSHLPPATDPSFGVVHRSEDKIRRVRYVNSNGEEAEREEHLLGACVFSYKPSEKGKHTRYYLSATDANAKGWGRGYFLSLLPCRVSTVDEAYEALWPKTLDKDAPHLRQGEFFLEPVPEFKAPKILHKRKTVNSFSGNKDGNPHAASELVKVGREIFIRGTLRHPEHYMVKMGRIWHRVHINRAVESWSAGGNVD